QGLQTTDSQAGSVVERCSIEEIVTGACSNRSRALQNHLQFVPDVLRVIINARVLPTRGPAERGRVKIRRAHTGIASLKALQSGGTGPSSTTTSAGNPVISRTHSPKKASSNIPTPP